MGQLIKFLSITWSTSFSACNKPSYQFLLVPEVPTPIEVPQQK